MARFLRGTCLSLQWVQVSLPFLNSGPLPLFQSAWLSGVLFVVAHVLYMNMYVQVHVDLALAHHDYGILQCAACTSEADRLCVSMCVT